MKWADRKQEGESEEHRGAGRDRGELTGSEEGGGEQM